MNEDPVPTPAEVRSEDRRQSLFLARLVHELRNPLAPIKMALQIMQASEGDVGTMQAAGVIINRQMRSLTRLIDDLADVTQAHPNTMALLRVRITLGALVRAAIDLARSQLESRQNAVTLELADEHLPLHVDSARMAQALANLLINACKFSALGSGIRVTASVHGADIVISVIDEGVGIPPTMLTRIFEPFVQVDSSGRGTYDGLGIGLTVVRNVVDAHGGTVWAEAAKDAPGSTVSIRIPHSNAGVAADPIGEKEPRAGAKLRILVADDNKDTAQTLAIMLRYEGHEVRTAHDGLEALAVGQLFLPDLVFLDIGMPVLDGYQTARQIRERDWGKNARLVALTGWGQEADRQTAIASGFHEHLVKTADPDRLKKVIESAQRARESSVRR